jgi:hypothetical protein
MKKIERFKEIIKKNFLLLWRSKDTVLTVFLGPLILIFLLGLAFDNTGLNKFSIASYSREYNNLSNSLLERLENNNFAVVKVESESECINTIKFGKNHLCIILPPNLEIEENNELIIYIDESKVLK